MKYQGEAGERDIACLLVELLSIVGASRVFMMQRVVIFVKVVVMTCFYFHCVTILIVYVPVDVGINNEYSDWCLFMILCWKLPTRCTFFKHAHVV